MNTLVCLAAKVLRGCRGKPPAMLLTPQAATPKDISDTTIPDKFQRGKCHNPDRVATQQKFRKK